jgi:hypothetical protein
LIDPLLATWRKKGRTRMQALMEPTIDTSAAAVEAPLRVKRRDSGSEKMPELGFSLPLGTALPSTRTRLVSR